MKVAWQGAPVINCLNEYRHYKDVVLLVGDMRSKWCEVDCIAGDDSGVPGFCIGTTERSLHLKRGKKRDEWTHVTLPEFVGWDIFTVEVCRYVVRVTLVKAPSGQEGKDNG